MSAAPLDLDAPQRTHPLAWVFLVAVVLFVAGAFLSRGTGPFHLGVVMGVVWLWVLLPVLGLAWFILARKGNLLSGP